MDNTVARNIVQRLVDLGAINRVTERWVNEVYALIPDDYIPGGK